MNKEEDIEYEYIELEEGAEIPDNVEYEYVEVPILDSENISSLDSSLSIKSGSFSDALDELDSFYFDDVDVTDTSIVEEKKTDIIEQILTEDKGTLVEEIVLNEDVRPVISETVKEIKEDVPSFEIVSLDNENSIIDVADFTSETGEIDYDALAAAINKQQGFDDVEQEPEVVSAPSFVDGTLEKKKDKLAEVLKIDEQSKIDAEVVSSKDLLKQFSSDKEKVVSVSKAPEIEIAITEEVKEVSSHAEKEVKLEEKVIDNIPDEESVVEKTNTPIAPIPVIDISPEVVSPVAEDTNNTASEVISTTTVTEDFVADDDEYEYEYVLEEDLSDEEILNLSKEAAEETSLSNEKVLDEVVKNEVVAPVVPIVAVVSEKLNNEPHKEEKVHKDIDEDFLDYKAEYVLGRNYIVSKNSFNALKISKSVDSKVLLGTDENDIILVDMGLSSYGWNVSFDSGVAMSLSDVIIYQSRHNSLPSSSGQIAYGKKVFKFSDIRKITTYEEPQYFSYQRI